MSTFRYLQKWLSQQRRTLPSSCRGSVKVGQAFVRKWNLENFANPRDWRLDDRTINDTDSFSSDKQVSCNNATATVIQKKNKFANCIQANATKRCLWSGLDHLLVIWSIGSAFVWVVMLSVCFYKNSKKTPNWMAYR